MADSIKCSRLYQTLISIKLPVLGKREALPDAKPGLGVSSDVGAPVDPNSTGNRQIDQILNSPRVKALMDNALKVLAKQADHSLEPEELRAVKTVGSVGERFIVSRGDGLLVARNTKIGGTEYEIVAIAGDTYKESRVIGTHSLILTETRKAADEKVTYHFNAVVMGTQGKPINSGFVSNTPIRTMELGNSRGTVFFGDDDVIAYVPLERDGKKIGMVQRRLSGISGRVEEISYETINGVQYLKVQSGAPKAGAHYYHAASFQGDVADVQPTISMLANDGHQMKILDSNELLLATKVKGDSGVSTKLLLIHATDSVAAPSSTSMPGDISLEGLTKVKSLPKATFYQVGDSTIVVEKAGEGIRSIETVSFGKVVDSSSDRVAYLSSFDLNDAPTNYLNIFTNVHTKAVDGSKSSDKLVKFSVSVPGKAMKIAKPPKGMSDDSHLLYFTVPLKRERVAIGESTIVVDTKNQVTLDLGRVLETRKVSAEGKSYDVIISENPETKKIGMMLYSTTDRQFLNTATLPNGHLLTSGTIKGPSPLGFEIVPGSLTVKSDPNQTAIMVSGKIENQTYQSAVSILRVGDGAVKEKTLFNLYDAKVVGKQADESVYVGQQADNFEPGAENKAVVVTVSKSGIASYPINAHVTEVNLSGNFVGIRGEVRGVGTQLPVESRWNVGEARGDTYFIVNKRPTPEYTDPQGAFTVSVADPSGGNPARAMIFHKSGRFEEVALPGTGEPVLSVSRDKNLLFVTTGNHKENASTVIYDLDKSRSETVIHNFQGYRDVGKYRFYVGHPSGNGNSALGVFDLKTNRFVTMFDFGQVKVDLKRPDAIVRDEQKGQIRFTTSTGAVRIFDERQNAFVGLLPEPILKEFETLNKDLGTLLNSKMFAANDDLIVGRDDAIKAIHGAMPADNNLREGPRYVVLKGDSGAGRTAIIKQYIAQVIGGEGSNGFGLKPVFFEMDPSKVSDGAIYRGMAQAKFTELARVAEALKKKGYRLVLVVDNVDRIKPETGMRYDQETDVFGQIAVLKDKTQMDILVTAKPQGWDLMTRQSSELTTGFQEVRVEGMSVPKTVSSIKQLLANRYPGKKVVEDNVIEYAVATLARLDQRSVLPGPPMTLIKDLVTETLATCKGECLVTRQMINQRIASKTGLPQLLISGKPEDAKQFLDGLRAHMLSKVSGQDAQIDEIVESFRSFALGINQKDVPIMSYLSAGPTGVGKTETLKALTEYVYGDSKALLKINGADYQPPMSGESLHQLTQVIVEQMRKYPFNTVLFDEIEKMDPNGAKLLLALLDGNATDTYGNKISSGMSMIFATSNLGMGKIIAENAKRVNTGAPKLSIPERNKMHWDGILNHFSGFPELIRRFDGHLFYNPLTDSDAGSIVNIYMKQHIDSAMQDTGVNLVYDQQTVEVMGKAFMDETFGARGTTKEIKRVFTNQFLSAEMLAGRVKPGGKYRLTATIEPGKRYPTFKVEPIK